MITSRKSEEEILFMTYHIAKKTLPTVYLLKTGLKVYQKGLLGTNIDLW